MSLSWLDLRPKLRISLCNRPAASVSWLGRRTANWALADASHAVDSLGDISTLLDQLVDAKPEQYSRIVDRSSAASVVFPDKFARFQLLPWTSALMRQEELHQFAIERFELMGLSVRDGWVTQAQWRGNGTPALAYAVPHALIDELHGRLARRGITLTSALPLSAAAHYTRLGFSRRHELSIVCSAFSVNALLYVNGQLAAFYYEPFRNRVDDGIRRVIARLAACQPERSLSALHYTLYGADPVVLRDAIHLGADTQVHVCDPIRCLT